MVFSSILFLFRFLPVTFLVYYLAPKKIKNLVLLIASLIFYSWGEVRSFRAAVPAVPYSAAHKKPHHAAYSIKIAKAYIPVKDFYITFLSFILNYLILFFLAPRQFFRDVFPGNPLLRHDDHEVIEVIGDRVQ